MAANSQKSKRNPAAHLAGHKFKPGQSGNPSGRPKKKPITEAYERLLEAQPELAEQIAESVVRQIIAGAKGSGVQLKEFTERVEGKITEQVEHSGLNGAPISLIVSFVKPSA